MVFAPTSYNRHPAILHSPGFAMSPRLALANAARTCFALVCVLGAVSQQDGKPVGPAVTTPSKNATSGAPPWLCDTDTVADTLKGCLDTFRAAKIEGYFLLDATIEDDSLCEVVDSAMQEWGICLQKSQCINSDNEEWLTKSCKNEGVVYKLLSLSNVPMGCNPDCTRLFAPSPEPASPPKKAWSTPPNKSQTTKSQ